MKYITKHHITMLSANVKTGPMTVTRTTTDTCPASCPLRVEFIFDPETGEIKEKGPCYDLSGNGAIHRRKVNDPESNYKRLTIDEFFEALPNFTVLYRMNEGGDLWNGKTDEHIDPILLKRFVDANEYWRKTAILYTHKPTVGKRSHWQVRKANRQAIKDANSSHAINVSVESLEEVDEAFGYGLDVVTVLPMDANEQRKRSTKTPKGKLVVHCPASWGNVSCVGGMDAKTGTLKKACGGSKGALCTIKGRDYAIGFPAHGASKKSLSSQILNNAA